MISREKRVFKAYLGKGLNDREVKGYAEKVMEERLRDDARRDITVEAILKKDGMVKGIIKSKEEGVLAGLKEVLSFYKKHKIKAKPLKRDGDRLQKGEVIAELKGRKSDLLKVERTGLNLLERMSGIATQTRRWVDIANSYRVKIVGTRKTLLNTLDKKAIRIGGGLPHRMGLYDAILIKDNHLSAIREEGHENEIETAIERAFLSDWRKETPFIEVEVSSLKDALRAAIKFKEMLSTFPLLEDFEKTGAFPCILLLDNMKPKEIKKTIASLKKKGLYDYVLLEASGGITRKNIKRYVCTGVDAISIGAITHSVKALDMNQKIIGKQE